MSNFGGFKLVVCRNVGHASRDSIAVTFGVAVADKTVARWEHRDATCIINKSRCFFQRHEASIAEGRGWSVISIRGDATNSAACHKEKVQSLEVRAVYPNMSSVHDYAASFFGRLLRVVELV